jgi:hypothetical protein
VEKHLDGIYVKETALFNIFKSQMKGRACEKESHDKITFTSSPTIGTERVIAFVSEQQIKVATIEKPSQA